MAIPPALTEDLKGLLAKEELTVDTIRQITKLIATKQSSVLHLIEGLQADLLNTQTGQRCKAVATVSRVLESLLPSPGLSEKETELLTEFFCSKLKDHHSILPSTLQGILAISTSPALPKGLAKVIAQAIFQDVHCQSQLQMDRRKIYKTFKNLLTFKLAELQELGQDFVFGFIQAVDQERDPRNLLILFSLFPIVAKYFRLEPFTEELFEVFSCYFPVDFSAPSEDPYGVTKEELQIGLRKCLASSAQFAEYCLPLLEEKLESDLISAKVESFKALEACCATYHPTQLAKWLDVFWTAIRREVLINVNSDELEHAALDALTALSNAFTTDEQLNNPDFTRVLKSITTECQGHLCEPERRLMTPSSYILLAICAGSRPACRLIMSQVIPLLIDQYQNRPQVSPRQFIVNTLNKMVHAGLYSFTEQNVAESGVDPMAPRLLDIYTSILNEQDDVQLHILSLQGLNHLVGVRLNERESERVHQTLLEMLKRSSTAENVAEEISNFFFKSAQHHQEWVVAQVVPHLFIMIETGNSKAAFQVMSRLTSLPAICTQLVPRLMVMLEKNDLPLRAGLLQVLTQSNSLESGDQLQLFQRMHSWAVTTAVDSDGLPSLHAACVILRNLSSGMSSTSAVAFIDHQVDTYINQCLPASPWVVCIMEATLGSLETVPNGAILERLVSALEPFALNHALSEVRSSACRLLASLINKLPEGSELDNLIDRLMKKRQDPSIDRNHAISLLVWITKALVMRSYSKVEQSIQELVDALKDPTLGYMAAEGFKIILSETVECLNMNSHANIKLMYRQRFFQDVVPRLLDLYRHSDAGNNKAACLTAIANQLAFIPRGVLLSHTATLVPLLIQCLTSEQPEQLVASSIDALLDLMADNTSAVVEYIDSLVPRLLKLAQDGRTMHVRRLALGGLSELRRAPQIVLLPLRSQVIFELTSCLGDKKRLVRREAALARQKWCMLGQPGGQ